MESRGTLILAAITLLAAVAYYAGRPAEPVVVRRDASGDTRIVESTPLKKLLDFEPASVTAVTLRFRGDQVSASREGGAWRGASDGGRLDDFLSSLAETVEIAPIAAEGAKLGDFGLDDPERTVVMDRGGAPQIQVAIGSRNPAGTATYVRISEGPVALAGALIVWEFDKGYGAITGRLRPE